MISSVAGADVARRVERQSGLLLREPVHVAVEDRQRVAGHGHREACGGEASDHRIQVAKGRGARARCGP